MRVITQSVIALGLAAVFSAAHAKSFCPVPPQTCGGPHKLTRLPDGALAISNICDLQAIPANAIDSYELTQDIDATCTSKWEPGFRPVAEFGGIFEGHNHHVNGLTIRSTSQDVGLFETIEPGASISNIDLTNAAVSGSEDGQSIGGLVGAMNGGSIFSSYVSGNIKGTAPNVTLQHIGGMVGSEDSGNASIILSSSGAMISASTGGDNNGLYAYGGLVGHNYGAIYASFSFGDVSGDGANGETGGNGGGLIGFNSGGTITHSASSSSVLGASSLIGGLVGWNSSGAISQSYSTGEIINADNGVAGGLVELNDGAGEIIESYSVGKLTSAGTIGGLVDRSNPDSVVRSFWDLNTSGTTVSAGGTGLSTRAFKAQMPAGFDPNVWGQVPGVSYPFDILYSCPWSGAQASNCTLPPFYAKTRFPLRDPNCSDRDDFFCLVVPPIMSFFEPPLAQFTASKKQFGKNAGVRTILPVGQLQLFDYTTYKNGEAIVEDDFGDQVPAAKVACLGTVYTMLARLIGEIYPKAKVVADVGVPNICRKKELASGAHIDCFLEDSEDLKIKGQAIWPTSMRKYATIGSYVAINDSALRAIVENGQLAIIHGTTGGLNHVMLVTSEIKDPSGNVIRFVANDPELGMQVFIDTNPADGTAYHRAVMHPLGSGSPSEYANLSGFNFTADQYAAINWH